MGDEVLIVEDLEKTSQELRCGSPQGPRLCDQQDQPSLQGAPRLVYACIGIGNRVFRRGFFNVFQPIASSALSRAISASS